MTAYYCGFGGNFCGESYNDDVNPRASIVILAYADIAPNGEIIIDAVNFPKAQFTNWKNTGKKVFLSIGGHKSDWTYVHSSETNRANFVKSTTEAVRIYGLDGIDFDIEANYNAPPKQVAITINELKKSISVLGKKYISVSPDCVTIYQGTAVPDPDKGGQPFNYMVPIFQYADSSIDFYQPKAYSNWYDGLAGGSIEYYQDVYLQWRNMKSLCDGCPLIPNFAGISVNKLVMGVLASPDARTAADYSSPAVIIAFKNWLRSKGYDMYGFQLWNSYWDMRNGNVISNAVISN